ncbi:hypothetical protein TWF730_007392 [Orbilia blumenaviensis]|uniref:Uncharacterized protein n=1 Tax=Orbilia blumenaviensis TaxID=1796055 RepID=A0AAV9VAK2_9PEZI
MRPICLNPSMRPGNEAFLTGFLINAYATRQHLIRTGSIRTKGGKVLPLELWLQINDELEVLRDHEIEKWIFVVCKQITTKTAPSGKITTTLICHQAKPHGGWRHGGCDDIDEINEAQKALDQPLEDPDCYWNINPEVKFRIELSEDTPTVPHIYENPTVPDVIARLEPIGCGVCLSERTICPGCSSGGHWIAKRFDAFLPWCEEVDGGPPSNPTYLLPTERIQLVCPLCVGMDKMREDKLWHTLHKESATPKEIRERIERCNSWFEELGYDVRFKIPESKDFGGTLSKMFEKLWKE